MGVYTQAGGTEARGADEDDGAHTFGGKNNTKMNHMYTWRVEPREVHVRGAAGGRT